MNLNLTGQSDIRDQIAPKLQQLKQAMNARKVLWDRRSVEEKRRWIQHAAAKDPLMDIAWDVFRYLYRNFFQEATGDA